MQRSRTSLIVFVSLAATVACFDCSPARLADDADVGAVPDATPAEAGAPRRAWAHRYVGDVQIDAITSGAQGAVFASGYFVGRAEFAPGRALDSVADTSGSPSKDIYVTAHDGATGALTWLRHFGGSGAEGNIYDMVTGADGTVAISGAFSGTVDLDGRMLTATVAAGSGSASSGTYGNMLVAGLDPTTGAVRWAHQATGDRVSGGNEIAPHPAGGYVQVGIFGGAAAAGGAAVVGGTRVAFEGGFFDSYVARLSADGAARWVVSIGGGGAQRGKAIATDARGNVLVAGDGWNGETSFGPGQSFRSTDQDFWVAKYSPDGALLWFRSFRSSGVDEVKGIAADPSGAVIVAGAFAGPSLELVGRTIAAPAGASNTGVVFALAPDGSRTLWAETIASVGQCCELEVDARGHAFASNAARAPSVRYGSGSTFALGGAAVRGALLTELGAEGARVASWTVRAQDAEFGELSLLASGGVAVAGSFAGATMSFEDVTLAGSGARTQFVLAW